MKGCSYVVKVLNPKKHPSLEVNVFENLDTGVRMMPALASFDVRPDFLSEQLRHLALYEPGRGGPSHDHMHARGASGLKLGRRVVRSKF